LLGADVEPIDDVAERKHDVRSSGVRETHRRRRSYRIFSSSIVDKSIPSVRKPRGRAARVQKGKGATSSFWFFHMQHEDNAADAPSEIEAEGGV
jgi:hypothetical protein